MLKILAIIPVWGRQRITRLQIDNLARVSKELSEYLQITPLYAISEYWAEDLCLAQGLDYFMHKNQPLGNKLNNALKSVIDEKFDFLMTCGSDNFIEPDFLKEYLPYFKQYDAFGVNVVNAIEESTGKQKEMQITYPFGAFRCIAWDLVQMMEGNLWPENEKRGLDFYSMQKLKAETGQEIQIVYTENRVWDVKSGENINTFAKVAGNVIHCDNLPLEIAYLNIHHNV